MFTELKMQLNCKICLNILKTSELLLSKGVGVLVTETRTHYNATVKIEPDYYSQNQKTNYKL